ncbi:hypothetical protein V493_01707 [Pseudogymnoascus sp. VKM F-4281 (FW-2241)]|nr:hypothetical protein V493_01707 [Pseudogymnoascus sp. VKM F-4281 (FW-2241)]
MDALVEKGKAGGEAALTYKKFAGAANKTIAKINEFIDALVEKDKAGGEAGEAAKTQNEFAEAHKTFATEVLAKIKDLMDAVDTIDPGASEKEVQALIQTGYNRIHERLDKFVPSDDSTLNGFKNLTTLLQSKFAELTSAYNCLATKDGVASLEQSLERSIQVQEGGRRRSFGSEQIAQRVLQSTSCYFEAVRIPPRIMRKY